MPNQEGRAGEALTFTVKQMAERLQISLPSAYQLTEKKGFPLIRVGAKKLIPVLQLTHWLEVQSGKDEEDE